MKLGHVASIALVCTISLAPSARGQGRFPPDSFTNLKVLPRTIPPRELVSMMIGFTRALGVRCTFCHVGEENVPLEKYDFPNDEKPTKRKAREMLKMVAAINDQYLAKLDKRVDPPIQVQCATCHRGVREPRPLSEILLANYNSNGLDSTLATYRSLRERYYGRASYEFGEVTLDDVARAVYGQGKPADALRLLALNLELLPNSAFAQRQYSTRALELAFDDRGPGAGKTLYQELKGKYAAAVTEETLNTAGYALLGRKRIAAALSALQLNAELFPQSANVYDSLGEVLAAAGDTAKAVASYQHSLSLNPDNAGAKRFIESVRDSRRR
jgi:tetratricopeptide (TPR) repeat protein